jgi:UDP-glucose 4-epimerase
MSNKKIVIVTGGAGFIGSHTVESLLEQGFVVRVLDNLSGGSIVNLEKVINNKNLIFQNSDIRKISQNSSFFKKVYGIIHFAGSGSIVPSIENPNFYIQNNLNGTVNLLEAVVKNNIKNFVYAASSSCYGKTAAVPTKETAKISCEHPYALSKYFGEQAALHWGKIYKFKCNSLRIFNAFGPRLTTKGSYGTVFAVFMKQIIENKPLTLVGNGSQKRDYVYVEDVADIFIKALKIKTKSRIFNVGNGNPQSIKCMIKLLVGKNYKIIKIPERPGEPKVTMADISLANSELKWKPKISFANGLSIMLENIDYWKNAVLWDSNNIKMATKVWFKYLKK